MDNEAAKAGLAGPGPERTRVGMVLVDGELREYEGRFGELAGEAEAGGVDQLAVGDHVSFRDGYGSDGLLQATALLATSSRITVQTGVYLLALRHPVVVARQLAGLATMAPGRLIFGVGVGGDDPNEYRACGLDPSTRGARTDESLLVLRELLAGGQVSHAGAHFSFGPATVRPRPEPPIPVQIGGRSDAAWRRTARFGDGWLGLWVSPDRFAEATSKIHDLAIEQGRRPRRWQHGMQMWVGLGTTVAKARRRVAATMEALYGLPFERFERYTPYGEPSDVVDSLMPYWERGCRAFNLTPATRSLQDAIQHCAEVGRLLRQRTDGRVQQQPSTKGT